MKQDEQVISIQKKNNSRFLFPYIVSLCSLMLCCAMFLGTTYAWFSSNVSSVGNRINSGGLNVDVRHDGVSLKNDTMHTVFSGAAWQPDRIRMETVELCNLGSLPLCFVVDFIPDENNVASATVTDLFQVYVKAGECTAQDLAAPNGNALNVEWTNVGSLTDVMGGGVCLIRSEDLNTPVEPDKGVLSAGETQPVSIALYMPYHTNQSIMGDNVALFLQVDVLQETQEDAVPVP